MALLDCGTMEVFQQDMVECRYITTINGATFVVKFSDKMKLMLYVETWAILVL